MPNKTHTLSEKILKEIEALEIESVQSVYLNVCLKTNPSFYNNRDSRYLQQLATRFSNKNQESISEAEIRVGNQTNALALDIISELGYFAKEGNQLRLYDPRSSCLSFFHTKHDLDTDRASRVNRMAAMAKEKRLGSCELQASLAYSLLTESEETKDHSIELVAMDNYDHFFIILGREAGEIDKPETWNDEATVIDPFAHVWYPAKQLNIKMTELINMNAVFPKPWSWNATITDLSIVVSNKELRLNFSI